MSKDSRATPYLDGTETPAPADPEVPPGFAAYAWARARGCCEQCGGRAFKVAHIFNGNYPARVLCERCYAAHF
jgi:hypothetical protein